MRSIPKSTKVLLFIDIAACLFRSFLWIGQIVDARRLDLLSKFPVLAPSLLVLGVLYIVAFLFSDILVLWRSSLGFPLAWAGFGFVAAHLCVGLMLQLKPSYPLYAANSGELAGMIVHHGVRVIFNLVFLTSLLKLKGAWHTPNPSLKSDPTCTA